MKQLAMHTAPMLSHSTKLASPPESLDLCPRSLSHSLPLPPRHLDGLRVCECFHVYSLGSSLWSIPSLITACLANNPTGGADANYNRPDPGNRTPAHLYRGADEAPTTRFRAATDNIATNIATSLGHCHHCPLIFVLLPTYI